MSWYKEHKQEWKEIIERIADGLGMVLENPEDIQSRHAPDYVVRLLEYYIRMEKMLKKDKE